MNPRAAINDLLPFQGSPFSHLGTSPKQLIYKEIMYKNIKTITDNLNQLSFLSVIEERRRWDSNPRTLSESPVFKTGSLNHSDTSPNVA